MKISILNTPDKDFNIYIESAVTYCMDKLVSKRISRNVTVIIRFNDKIDVHGYTSIYKYNSIKEPREFLIEVNPFLGSRGILTTIVHEMIHVWQYIDKKIDDYLETWCGEKVPEGTDYWDEPWEIEAYGMQAGLFTRFAEQQKLWYVFADIRDPKSGVEQKIIRWK